MEEFGAWVGFFGLFCAAVIALISSLLVNKNRNNFELGVCVRNSLQSLYNELIEHHSKVMKYKDSHKGNNYNESVQGFKIYHDYIMKKYNDFRIYYSRLYTYELESAIFNYYYEKTINQKDFALNQKEYDFSYQSINDAYELLINEVRSTLIGINNVYKSTRDFLVERHNEYKRYANRLIESAENNIPQEVINFKEKEDMNSLEKATYVVSYRIKRFEKEYKKRISNTNFKEKYLIRKKINEIFKKHK